MEGICEARATSVQKLLFMFFFRKEEQQGESRGIKAIEVEQGFVLSKNRFMKVLFKDIEVQKNHTKVSLSSAQEPG